MNELLLHMEPKGGRHWKNPQHTCFTPIRSHGSFFWLSQKTTQNTLKHPPFHKSRLQQGLFRNYSIK